MRLKMNVLFFALIVFTLFMLGRSGGAMPLKDWPALVMASTIVFVLVVSTSGAWAGLLRVAPLPSRLRLYLRPLPLSLMLIALLWVQIDFFSQTVFGWNSLSSGLTLGATVGVSAAVLLAFFGIHRALGRSTWNVGLRSFGISFTALVGLLMLSHMRKDFTSPRVSLPTQKPHIFILSFDSLEETAIDDRENFPYLNTVRDQFLVADQFYPNSCCTHGSIASLYTGSSPLITKVQYPPARLEGLFVTHNLPAALKSIGYTTHSLTTSYYASAKDLGLLDAFDSTMGYRKSLWDKAFVQLGELARPLQNLTQALSVRAGRYLAGNPKSASAFEEVSNAAVKVERDEEKLNFLLDRIADAEGPQFIHAHFMALHGLQPGEPRLKVVMNDFDAWIKRVFAALQERNLLETSLVVLTSDHGLLWKAEVEVPLWIRFPGQVPRGQRPGLTQTADIAPTLLDFLGVQHDLPFEGMSLLRPLPDDRTLFIADGLLQGDFKWEAPHFLIGSALTLNAKRKKHIPWEKFRLGAKGDIRVDDNESNLPF